MDINEQIEKFKEFIDSYYKSQLYELIQHGKKSLIISFSQLVDFNHELADDLLDNPEDTIRAAELSLEQFDLPGDVKKVAVRFKELPESQKIRISNIRSVHLDRFLYVDGIVRQASDVRPQVTSAKFECAGCGNTISILQIDTKFKEPSRCTCGWRGKFRLLSKDLIDVQHLKIEESPESLEGGEQPKRLSIFLKEDLVEPKMEKKTTPGSKIGIYGVVKEVPIPLKTGAQSVRYDLILEANYVEPIQEDYSNIVLTKEDEEQIISLSKDQKIFDKFARSIAPSIYGHDRIKEALVLQLFGGVRREKPDGTVSRGDVHVLLVGDPGSGKSQMLQFISKAAPKARFVSGKGSSGTGLTASVVKDEFLRGWALEAGALVLANKGLCCIDELDKIDKEDTGALHSAMEQQIIPISKANIQACYSEDTEVLTDCGWKKYFEVKESKIAQYNPKDKTIEFLKHKGLFIYDYNSLMYNFKNKRNDILVTPNHKMLYREARHKDYSFAEAQNIHYSRFRFLNSGNLVGEDAHHFILPPINHKQNRAHPKYVHQHSPKKIPMDLWLEFLGYYLSEGGLENRPTFGINQKIGKKAIKIRKCLVKLSNYVGFTLTELKDGPYWRFQITNTQLCTYLEANFGDHCFNKKLAIDFSKFSKRQLKILYNSMMLGDGASNGKSYGSTSLELIDGFHALACLVGMSASNNVHYNKDYRKNRRKMYRITLSERTELSFMKPFIKKVKYKGKVFCFSTNTGFFITRRSGKIAIQGNTLSAQTTLLAAANPKLGRFDPYTPIASQIDLPATLINRFDLIFPIRDIPSKERDERIALHVLETAHKEETYQTDITTEILRKYIAYAKQKIKPSMTKAAINEIKDYYVKLRNSGKADDEGIKPIPISARQLEGLIRLSEASARVRLDDKVTREDARKAIDLLTHCLMQVGFDPETGQIDIDRISTGISASTRSKIITVKDIILHLEAKGMKEIPIEEIIAEAAKRGIEESKVEEAIEQLKKSGDIFEPKRNFIARVG